MSKDPEEEEVVCLHGFKSDGPLAKFNDSLAIVVAITRCMFVRVGVCSPLTLFKASRVRLSMFHLIEMM